MSSHSLHRQLKCNIFTHFSHGANLSLRIKLHFYLLCRVVGQRPVWLLCGWVAPGTLGLYFRHESKLPACGTWGLNPGCPGAHLDLSMCPLLHKVCNLLQTERVVIQPESSGCLVLGEVANHYTNNTGFTAKILLVGVIENCPTFTITYCFIWTISFHNETLTYHNTDDPLFLQSIIIMNSVFGFWMLLSCEGVVIVHWSIGIFYT